MLLKTAFSLKKKTFPLQTEVKKKKHHVWTHPGLYHLLNILANLYKTSLIFKTPVNGVGMNNLLKGQ